MKIPAHPQIARSRFLRSIHFGLAAALALSSAESDLQPSEGPCQRQIRWLATRTPLGCPHFAAHKPVANRGPIRRQTQCCAVPTSSAARRDPPEFASHYPESPEGYGARPPDQAIRSISP